MDRLGTRFVGKVRGSGGGGGGELKGEITWWLIGDWQIVGERRGWQIKGVAKRGGALYIFQHKIYFICVLKRLIGVFTMIFHVGYILLHSPANITLYVYSTICDKCDN